MSILDRLRTIFGKQAASGTPPELTTAQKIQTERRKGPRRNPKPGTRILIIDDSATVIFAFKKILQNNNLVLLEALDAESGIIIAREQKPDLIFLDIVLPGMNGFAALRAMRRDPVTQAIPIIMISSNEQATEQFFGSKIGADDFLKKPFTRNEVYQHMANLLDINNVPRRIAEHVEGPTRT